MRTSFNTRGWRLDNRSRCESFNRPKAVRQRFFLARKSHGFDLRQLANCFGAFERKAVSTKDWFERYKDPRWQKLRLLVMNQAGFKCSMCGSADQTLNVHHICYKRGCNPWEYGPDELKCICEPCHEKFESEVKPYALFVATLLPPETMLTFFVFLNSGINAPEWGWDRKNLLGLLEAMAHYVRHNHHCSEEMKNCLEVKYHPGGQR